MYHPNNCKVDNGDDTVDSDFDTDVEANADSGEKNEDNYDDELDEERLSNAASFNWDDDFILYDSDNDDIVGQTSKAAELAKGKPYKKHDNGKNKLEVRQKFKSIYLFRQVLREYCGQDGFQLKRIKNASWRYIATCAAKGCSWCIHASHINEKKTFMIMTLNDRHYCQKVHKNQEATTAWVASRSKCMIEETAEVKVSFLRKKIHRIYGLAVPSHTFYRAKNIVLKMTDEEYTASYSKLHSYEFVVRARNLGSTVILRTITPTLGDPSIFQRYFLSFEAQKFGFLYRCRPFLGLEDCHLKGGFPGVLLSAIGIDANNGLYPIALCVCEGESKESWFWFINQLYEHIGKYKCRKITFMTNRQKRGYGCLGHTLARLI
ncbi:hypothetical protein ACOSP7_020753 [Xanthoceras sorbifolium]